MAEEKQQEELNLEKEKFDEGLTDEQIITQFGEWWDESDELYKVLEGVWEKNIDYYKGNQTEVDKIYGNQSKAVENRVWMAVETAVPIATSRLPDIDAVSMASDELSQMNADDLQSVLNYQFERLGLQEKAERFVRDMIVKRYGVFRVFWNDQEDDFGFRLVDPRRIRIPKFGYDIDSLKFLIEEIETSYENALLFFGEEHKDKLLRATETFKGKQKVRKKNLVVYEVWTNTYTCWIVGNEVLKKGKNEYYDFENVEKNFLPSPKKPYVIKSLFQTEESILGGTDYVQQHINIQDNINILNRRLENIVRKVSNPNLGIDSDVMTKEEAQMITNEEGFILYGKGAADESKIRFHQPGQVPQYLFNALQTARTEFDNIWGIHSTTRGEREGRETLGGRQLLRAADLGRIDLIARQLERAIDELANLATQLIKLFYSDKRSYSILGDDGTRFVKDFTKEKVGKVRLLIRPGSTLPKDEVTIHNEAITLWQLKAIGVKTLYKMLKLPNIEEAYRDWVGLNSGAALQGGGQAVVPPEQSGSLLPVRPQV